jgi:hypothetical protein
MNWTQFALPERTYVKYSPAGEAIAEDLLMSLTDFDGVGLMSL